MSEFKVNFGAVETAGADIGSAGKSIKDRLDKLDQDLSPLRADWTGAASESYTQAKDQWSRAITDMNQLLMDISNAVRESGSSYGDTEKSNSQIWG